MYHRQLRLCAYLIIAVGTVPASLGSDEFENISAYLRRRQDFIERESSISVGASLHLSKAEQRFDTWLGKTVHTIMDEYARHRLSGRFIPSNFFPKIRQHIEGSDLYRVLRMLPKGGALHLHDSSAGSLEWITLDGLDLPGCYVYWPDDPYSHREPPRQQPVLGTLAFFNGSAEQGFRLAKDLLLERPSFREELLKLLTLHSEDEGLTSAEIWQKFDDIFGRFRRFFTHRKAVEGFLRHVLKEFVADGVSHVELRFDLFHDVGALSDLDGRQYNGVEKVDIYQRVIEDAERSAPGLTVKLIATSSRFRAPDDIAKDLEYAFMVRAQRKILVGWDAAGEEDLGRPTVSYAQQLLARPQLSARFNVDLPLLLHDGESDWSSENVVDAVLLGAKRLGHGFNLLDHPLLSELVRKRGIAVEVCPISNQVLRFVDDLRLHPAARMLRQGLPVVISSDDPGVWRAKGLTHDFWEATVAWNLTTSSLKALAQNSLEYSCLSGTEKLRAQRHWSNEWDEFMGNWESLLLQPSVFTI